MLTRLFRDRGVRIDRMYQINFGGNTDFLNMLERERLESKKISKTNAVTSQLDYEMPAGDIHVGPSDYVPWLLDRKWCHIRMEGTTFGNVPLNLELKLEVWDSPNSAGVVIDAIRCCKLALDRGISGALIGPSSYFMKSPPKQFTDERARAMVEEFIAKRQGMIVDTIVYWIFRLIILLGRPFPPAVGYFFARIIADICYVFFFGKRRALKAAMARVLDTDDENAISLAARRSFRNFGKYVIDFIHFLDSTPEEVRRRIVFDDELRADKRRHGREEGRHLHHPALRKLGHGRGRPLRLRLPRQRRR